ncbi:MAG: DMT family transporter [Pseudomonadota bacterium]
MTIETIRRPGPIDFMAMGLTALIWASAFIAIKVVVGETGPWWLATYRVAIGFLAILPYALWRGFILPKTRAQWAVLTVTASFNVVIPFFLISWAETRIDAGLTALLMGTGAFFAIIGSHLFTRDDRLTVGKGLACALGFSAVLLVVGTEALAGLGGTNIVAQLAAVGAALSYTVAGILTRKIDIPPIRMGCLLFGLGLIQLVALSLLFSGPPVLAISSTAGWALLYLGVVPTALAQVLRLTLIRKVGYAVFALALNLIPVFGIGLGALLLSEVIQPTTFIALGMVLLGLFLSQQDKLFSRKAAKP